MNGRCGTSSDGHDNLVKCGLLEAGTVGDVELKVEVFLFLLFWEVVVRKEAWDARVT